jgi:hypothetical protein
MVSTRPAQLYDLLGNKDNRKELDRQFKKAESNFQKILRSRRIMKHTILLLAGLKEAFAPLYE